MQYNAIKSQDNNNFNDKPIFIITNKFFRNFIIDIIRQNDKINHVVSLYVLKLYFADILIYDSWNQQVKSKLKKKDKIQPLCSLNHLKCVYTSFNCFIVTPAASEK